MALIAAPGRQLKTYSAWITIALVLIDGGIGIANALGEAHVVSVQSLTVINSVLGALILVAKAVQQQIAVTPDQKVDMVLAAAQAPVKAGHQDPQITVTIQDPLARMRRSNRVAAKLR